MIFKPSFFPSRSVLDVGYGLLVVGSIVQSNQ